MTQCAESYDLDSFALPAANEHGEAPVIRVENPITTPDWDECVRNAPNHSFFYTSAWARVLQETYGFRPLYFTSREGSTLRGLLPIMEVDSWLTGRRGVSLPFTDQCEAIGSDPKVFGDLHAEALNFGRSRHWKYLETRGESNLMPPQGDVERRAEFEPRPASFYGHTLDLTVGEAKLHPQLASSVRRAIRKSETEGVVVEISSTLESIRFYYDLHCKTRKKHGVPPQSFAFFANIHKHILAKNLGFVAIAGYNNTPIAAAVFFHFGKKAIYKYGASDEDFLNFRGNNRVMWRAIQWYANAGFDSLDFGRTSLANDGLRRFKLGWGACETPISYCKYDFRRRECVAYKDDAVSWKNRMLRHLPTGMAKIIGSLLYRHAA